MIIGGGAAGAAAALAARAAGLSAALVQRAPGATALGCGGWRGPLPEVVANALAGQRLLHVDQGTPLPHPDGELLLFEYAAASHAAAAVETGACVVGIDGLPTFRPRALSRLWGEAAGAELVADSILVPGTTPTGWATLALAHTIEADPALLIEPLRAVVARTGCTRLILPAVLGATNPTAVRETLEAALGMPVGETLAVAPSLPGWRLHRALEAAVRAAGVRIIEGDVVDVRRSGDRVDTIDVLPTGAHETILLAADRFVLASGRYVGGGIAADPIFAETVFGASVWIEHLGERFDEVDPLVLSDPVRTEPQPLLTAGVRVDGRQRLGNGRGEWAITNVWAAGAVRAGVADGLGHAALDGVRAVEHMLQQA